MKKLKIAIALFLVLSFAVSLIAIMPTAAQITAVRDRPTGAYISTNPDLIGLNQEITVNLWVYPSPNGPNFEMGTTHPMVFNDLEVTFTRPDGSKDIFKPMHGSAAYGSFGYVAGQTDEVGGLWFLYKPNKVGTWTVQFTWPGKTFVEGNWSVYFVGSTSQVATFEVQQDYVEWTEAAPLPTGYWERPISAEFREWYQISGNWIPRYLLDVNGYFSNYNPYTTAPNSPHIVWKKQTNNPGGLVGGEWGSYSYSPASITQIII